MLEAISLWMPMLIRWPRQSANEKKMGKRTGTLRPHGLGVYLFENIIVRNKLKSRNNLDFFTARVKHYMGIKAPSPTSNARLFH